MSGGSGVGKSHLSKVISNECGMNVVVVSATELLSKYFGDTERQVMYL